MAYTLKFTKGGKRLDLMTGRYMTDFVPPDVALRPLISEGTSANKTGGGALIDTRAGNRSISFTVHVRGLSDHEVARGVADLRQWLGKAGDESEPLYLQYYPNDDIAREPLWGQRSIYYEVVFGDAVRLTDTYGMADIRTRQADCQVTVTVKPYAVGKKQRLAWAAGGVGEDVIGSPHGVSRGLQVSEVSPTGGNEFTNPVFGHSTYDTGWTIDANLTVVQNTDPEFLLPGTQSSVRCTARTTGPAIYQSINTGDTNTHAFSCYVKRPDGSAVTSTQCQLYYNAALTTTFTSVGDGWYRLTATATGINASTVTGLQVKDGYTVYASGFQMEQAAYSTPLFYGDLLGCAWSGTAHASASTRVAGSCKVAIADAVRVGSFSIRVVVKFHVTDDHPNNAILFDARDAVDTGAPFGYFNATNDDFVLAYGGTTIDTSAQTIAVGDVIVLHFVGSEPGGFIIYKNGASAASTATFAASTLGDYLFIGSDYSGGQQAPVTIMDITTWDVALTATEVLNDYTNVTQTAADNERVGAIPYLWTDGGDGVIDACDGVVSSTAKNNWGVADGIPGSAPAVTFFDIQCSVTFASIGELKISNNAVDYFRYPTDWCWFDLSGSADAGASSGDAYESGTVDTTGLTGFGSGSTILDPRMVEGKDALLVMRVYDSAASEVDYILQTSWGNFSSKFTAGTSFRLRNWGELSFQSTAQKFTRRGLIDSIGFTFVPDRTSGTGTVRIDYFALMVKPLMVLVFGTGYVNQGLIVEGNRAAEYVTSTNEFYQTAPVTGDIIEVVPGKRNILFALMGNSANDATVTRTFTYTKIIATPRYAIL